MALLTATISYEVSDKRPFHLAPGHRVVCGPRDTAWPGWIWVTLENGQSGWVPEEVLSRGAGQEAVVSETFEAREISVTKGERVESLRGLHGWHWCRKADGAEGWLPGYLLRA